MKNAQALYSQGKFDEAKAAYLESVERDPTNAATLERLGTIALWENKCAEAKHYFEEALRHLPWHKHLWPVNAQLKYRLALTHYRQDRFGKAASLFREAAGPVAIGPFHELKAFAQQMTLFESDTPYVVEGPGETRVDFLATDPLPVIEVSINGSGPLCFIIDTGGAEVILDRELVGRVGAQISSSFRTAYAGQKKAETGLGKIDSIQLGEVVLRNVPIHTLDTKAMSTIFDGLEISGIIGTRLLMHFLSTIDYANGALVLRRPASSSAQSLAARIREGGAKVIPFWLIEMHYMVAWGTINNQGPMLFFVDTGLAGAGFTAPESVLRQAGITVNWIEAQAGVGGAGEIKGVGFVVDRLTLGTGADEVVENNVQGSAIEGSVSILGDQLGFRIGGLISHQFFRKYALTLDFKGMRLILQ